MVPSKFVMLALLILFGLGNILFLLQIDNHETWALSGARNAVATPREIVGHHPRHPHQREIHTAVDQQQPLSRSPKEPHHKSSAYVPNVNHPDDMKPFKTALRSILLPPGRSYVSFLVIGDWGGPGRRPQQDVANAMSKVASQSIHLRAVPNGTDRFSMGFVDDTSSSAVHSVDFIVSTGDNMYEDGVRDENDAKFHSHFEKVYNKPSIENLVWFMALGNHDHGAHGVMRDVRGQIRYTARSSRWFMPSSYYSQVFQVVSKGPPNTQNFTLQLIVLDTYDTSPYRTLISRGQLRWFEQTLEASTADWRFVVGHRPIASAGAKHGSSPYLRSRLLPLMIKHQVSAYFCGDDHELQLLDAENVLLVVSGGGARAKADLKPGGINETLFQSSVHGFMAVALTQEVLAISVHDRNGTALYRLERRRKTP